MVLFVNDNSGILFIHSSFFIIGEVVILNCHITYETVLKSKIVRETDLGCYIVEEVIKSCYITQETIPNGYITQEVILDCPVDMDEE